MTDFKDLRIELNELLGISEPHSTRICFVVSEFEEPRVIMGDIGWLVVDMIGSAILVDILDDKELAKIPMEIGVYSGDLIAHSYKCNNFDDPTEWDMNIWLENIKLEFKL